MPRLLVRPGPAVLRQVDLAADALRVAALTGLGYALVIMSFEALAVFAVVVVVAHATARGAAPPRGPGRRPHVDGGRLLPDRAQDAAGRAAPGSPP